MKALVLLAAVLSVFGCKRKDIEDLGTAKPIDQAKVQAASARLCPSGQSLKVFTDDFLIYQEMPSPVFFAIENGTTRCSLRDTYREGDLTGWLSVEFPNDCLPNGSLWELDSLSRMDGDKCYLRLKPDDASLDRVYINFNDTKRLNRLRDRVGLVTYRCQP